MLASLPVVDARLIEDVDAMAAAIADGLEAEFVQLEAKPFAAHWTVIRLAGMVLQFGREDAAIVRRLRVPAGRWAFVVPLAVPDSARWNACRVSGDEVIMCGPGSECYAFDPGGTKFAIISIADGCDTTTQARYLLSGADRIAVVMSRAADAGQLRRHLAAALVAAGRPTRRGEPALGVGVAAALDRCLSRGHRRERHVDASIGRSQIVRRAAEFFRGHVGEPVSIARLSSIAGVSERSLRHAFNQVCTTSPKRYLRLWQLHQVRHALRSPAVRDATVTDVATLHGFYELGRFAGEYKALFGEVPSQTLHRARSAARLCGAAYRHATVASAAAAAS
jgi:AraC family transcriptional regulator, ethanolamine operon transcriptional activator